MARWAVKNCYLVLTVRQVWQIWQVTFLVGMEKFGGVLLRVRSVDKLGSCCICLLVGVAQCAIVISMTSWYAGSCLAVLFNYSPYYACSFYAFLVYQHGLIPWPVITATKLTHFTCTCFSLLCSIINESQTSSWFGDYFWEVYVYICMIYI